jgi:tetratricopeptide (TPR) repeat protein
MRKSKNLLFVSFLISFITILVYLPSLQNDFVNWDDDKYVYENPNIQHIGLRSIHWMFTTFHAANWHPLTWFSHAIDYAIWGLNPMGHHLTSIIFHGLNTFLVVVIVMFLVNFAQKDNFTSTISGNNKNISIIILIAGAITGLLFGIHPLHVESVAWVSERKDVLYAFFFLLSILSYLKYTSSSLLQRQKTLYYSLCLLFFVLSLISKPMAVTLPVVLIILDVYPLGRLDLKTVFTSKRKALMEKVPFFGLSLASSVVTIIAQKKGGAITFFEDISLSERILTAIRALAFYLYKILWPAKLVPLYPYPAEISFFTLEYLLALIIVFFITAFSVYFWKKQKTWLVVWTFYLVTLLPVLGLIQVGRQAAADRYTYMPSLGLFLLIGLLVAKLIGNTFTKEPWKGFKKLNVVVITIVTMIILVPLINITVNQQKIWRDSKTMWNSVIKIFPDSAYTAYLNLGVYYKSQGFIEKAIRQYKITIELNPNLSEAHYNLGNAYKAKGLFDKAIRHYKIALETKDDYAEAHNNLGNAYKAKGLFDKAIRHYKIARRLNPDLFDKKRNQK